MYNKIRIKEEKERFIFTRHPWAFRNSLWEKDMAGLENGVPVHLVNSENKIVATGSYSSESIMAVRIFAFEEIEFTKEWWSEKIKSLKINRETLGYGDNTDTTGYRLVYGESDGIPGLVIDRFDKVFVAQSATAFIDIQLGKIADALFDSFKVDAIYSKSTIDVRKSEGITPDSWDIYSKLPKQIEFKENGFTFIADVAEGQKTGFYLDQKDLRTQVLRFSDLIKDKKVLNLFSYSGATGVYAMKAGAESVHNVDLSERALDVAAENAELNNISLKSFTTEKADAFDWLETNKTKYDVIILDPPALVKGRKFKGRGEKAYHYLNKGALRSLAKGGILITSSCSHFLPDDQFAFILRQSATQLGKKLKTLTQVAQSDDHPYSIYFPEGRYLTSFILQDVSK